MTTLQLQKRLYEAHFRRFEATEEIAFTGYVLELRGLVQLSDDDIEKHTEAQLRALLLSKLSVLKITMVNKIEEKEKEIAIWEEP